MQAHGRLTQPPIFLPVVGAFFKGLAVSVPLSLADLGLSAKSLHEAYLDAFARERFVRVMPLCDEETLREGFFDVQGCNDSNRADIFVFANQTQALVMARLDNLGKGASGAAVQSMNVHLGLDEGLGLAG
jgi:N-acetyl-gamma-glutamyl-phosphate reductase